MPRHSFQQPSSSYEKRIRTVAASVAVLIPFLHGAGWAQEPTVGQSEIRSGAPTLCGQPLPEPARVPPGPGPVVYFLGLCFSAQENVSSVEPETYLHYIQLRPSRPSQDEWVAYDEEAEHTILADFRRLWSTNFLDDLKVETSDYTFANGVIGKVVTYHIEERRRIKIVTYDGSKELDRGKLDERLRERGVTLRVDSFLDEGTIRQVETVVREMLTERGFTNAKVTHIVADIPNRPKVANVTFNISDGPRLTIRDVTFIGNRAVDDATLTRALKENRPQGLLSFVTGGGRYNEHKFAEDAENVEEYYRDRGYITARVGRPELRELDDSPDRSTRWVQLRIPVTEGQPFRIGEVTFEGNQIVGAEVLEQLFKLKTGERYSQKAVRAGLEKAREIYGAAGYMEFTALPDLRPRNPPDSSGNGGAGHDASEPIVDVILRVTEGPRYFVNRITFTGNTTTRDHVIRREMRLIEGGVFNTEALKYSVRRLNQLGYFKPIEGSSKDLEVEKARGREHAVDVTVKLQEQNRNQVQFGAGMSQYEGVFGNLSYTTSNFMGRGESLTLSAQKGARSSMYQLAFTEPYVLDRPITAALDLFSRKIDYLTGVGIVGYSEVRSGINVTGGQALFAFSRLFLTYGYEVIDTAVSDDLKEGLDDQASVGVPLFNPFLDEGRHIESRVTPSFVHNTVDNPFTPRRGLKLTLSAPVAGGFLGGTADYIRPELEAVMYIPHTSRTALGVRVSGGWLRPFGGTRVLPYYLRYFLGGEYQIRGVDIRTVGPTDAGNRALGGDKFVLFNAEYYFDVIGPVRALLFHDAGQSYLEGQPINLRQLRTSSGAELRVIVPMLNVPFRLIYAWNIYRDVFQPARTFKFAVGTTF
jgi:outer membrane protein insertion porin family